MSFRKHPILPCLIIVLTVSACCHVAAVPEASEQAGAVPESWQMTDPVGDGVYAGAIIDISNPERPVLLALDRSEIVFVRCHDIACHSFSSKVIARFRSGDYAVWSRGQSPTIVYAESRQGPLKIVKCRDMYCASFAEEQIAPFDHDVWQIVPDDRDLVFVVQRRDGSLIRLRCSGSDCSQPLVSDIPFRNSSQVTAAGTADATWIFAVGPEFESLRALRCDQTNCSAASIVGGPVTRDEWKPQASTEPQRRSTESALSGEGEWMLRVSSQGTPFSAPSALLAERKVGDGETAETVLRLITCSGNRCVLSGFGSWPAVHTNYVDIATGPTSFPVVAFTDKRDGTLRLGTCQDVKCDNVTMTDIGGGVLYALTVGHDDLPVVVSSSAREGVLRLIRCTDRSCKTSTSTMIDLSAR